MCGVPSCATILSRYNCEVLCWGHEQSARAAHIAAEAEHLASSLGARRARTSVETTLAVTTDVP